MLQRAASNAYSWWWASHIRTKQSKWIEQNLQDMEEKVKYILNLIEEDGDSFAKRAEMYYKKRPELINFVEDSFRAYRALAERYDHISGELQNANNTIATVFPEQAQFAMDEEDDDGSPKAATSSLSPSKLSKAMPEAPKLDIPKAWKNQKKGAKGLSRLPTKKVQPKKATSSTTTTSSRKSKAEALVEIDRLQKGILSLQTEKEFFKSSYESGLAKYWEIEKHITEMQEEVCILQDEFSVGTVIEDDEARTLMAATALKSCQETLSKLQEKQEQSAEEAKVEYQRIKDAHEKLETLKNEFLSKQMDQLEPSDENDSTSSGSNLKNLEQEVGDLRQERLELELVRKKIREHFEMNSDTSLTVTELAEKIDELVNKVISLEYAVSSQTALIKRLRSETDDIQVHLRNLDENKATLVKGSNNLSNKLRNLDEKLSGIQDLNRSVEDQNNNLQTHFTEACCNLNHLSEKLHFVKADEEAEIMGSPQTEMGVLLDAKIYEKIEERKILVTCGDGSKNSEDTISEVEEADQVHNLSVCSKDNEKDSGQSKVSNSIDISEECEDPKQQGKVEKQDLSQTEDDVFNVDSQEDCNVNHLSENLHFVKPCEEADITDSPQAEMGVLVDAKTHETLKEGEDMVTPSGDLENSKDTKTNLEEETGDIQNLSLYVKNDEQDTDHSKRNSADDSSEKREEPKQLDKFEKQDSNRAEDNFFYLDSQERSTEQENLPNWQQLFLNGLEGREKILLAEYTSILRNYKETKKKLSEAEKKNRDNAFETMVQLRELKRANAVKDEEIRSLRQNICFLKTSFDGNLDNNLIEFKDSQQVKPYVDMAEGSTFQFPNIPYSDHQPVFDLLEDQNVEPGARIKESTATGKTETYPTEEEIKVILVDEPHAVSNIEEKFRRDIDELLEENLEFWLRFSTSFHQIQKFRTTIQDLQAEFLKLKENKKQDANSSTWRSLKSDARPIYKHLREIQTELTVWLEQNALLKDELQYRFSSLCTIQEEISKVSKAGSETEEAELTSYQAAKFQGEVLNMQQENNKVADELQAGLDHVRGLQFEIEKTLSKLDEDFDLSGSKSHQHHVKHSSSRPRIPLRSFIFGVKQKKQRPSIFKCMNPALQKQYSDLTSGFPP